MQRAYGGTSLSLKCECTSSNLPYFMQAVLPHFEHSPEMLSLDA